MSDGKKPQRTMDELRAHFKAMIAKSVTDYIAAVPDPDKSDVIDCAYCAGMLLILSAFKRFDGPSLPIQVSVMHAALREYGAERGWSVERNVGG